jgi:hypothetical protein
VLAVRMYSCDSLMEDTEVTSNPLSMVLRREVVADDLEATKIVAGCGFVSCFFKRSISVSACDLC